MAFRVLKVTGSDGTSAVSLLPEGEAHADEITRLATEFQDRGLAFEVLKPIHSGTLKDFEAWVVVHYPVKKVVEVDPAPSSAKDYAALAVEDMQVTLRDAFSGKETLVVSPSEKKRR